MAENVKGMVGRPSVRAYYLPASEAPKMARLKM